MFGKQSSLEYRKALPGRSSDFLYIVIYGVLHKLMGERVEDVVALSKVTRLTYYPSFGISG